MLPLFYCLIIVGFSAYSLYDPMPIQVNVRQRFVALLCTGLVASPLLYAADPAASNAVLVQGPNGKVQVVEDDIRVQALAIPEQQRAEALAKTDAVTQVARGLYIRRTMAAEAQNMGLESRPEVVTALRQARERVLSDAWIANSIQKSDPHAMALETYARNTYKAEGDKRFALPEEWRASHILVKITAEVDEAAARAKAEKILAELKAGANFADTAKQFSEDPGSGAKGGDLGSFGRGRMVKPFEEAVAQLRTPGELSPLVRSDFGFHIIRLDEHHPARVKPYEEVADQLRAESRDRVISEVRQRDVQRILDTAKVDEAAVKAFSARYATTPAPAAAAPVAVPAPAAAPAAGK